MERGTTYVSASSFGGCWLSRPSDIPQRAGGWPSLLESCVINELLSVLSLACARLTEILTLLLTLFHRQGCRCYWRERCNLSLPQPRLAKPGDVDLSKKYEANICCLRSAIRTLVILKKKNPMSFFSSEKIKNVKGSSFYPCPENCLKISWYGEKQD